MNNNFKFGKGSLSHLENIQPELRACVELALTLSEIDFSVVEGLRSPARQVELFEEGLTQTLDSYHLVGRAVDLYPWTGMTNHSPEAYKKLARAMFKASQRLGLEIEWGGLWTTFVDKPHWQLPGGRDE